jgi:sigma-B regulation protein RsbU (phosphoserine phosphatase)
MRAFNDLHGLAPPLVGTGNLLENDSSRLVPVNQIVAALGDVDSPRELAQRLSVALSLLWSEVAEADLLALVPRVGLRSVRESRVGAGMVALLRREWSRVAPPGVMVFRPLLMPRELGGGRGSMMSVPLVAAGATFEGFLLVQRRAGAPDFGARDLAHLAELGIAVGNLLPRVRRKAKRAAAWSQVDMACARQVQGRLLPEVRELQAGRVRVVARYLPAFAVGGDFYDVVDLGAGRVMVAIGDVSGKGVTAALMMSRVSSELRRLVTGGASPAEVLTGLNQALPTWMGDDRFVTVVCAALDLDKGEWTVANAGHVFPLLRRACGVVLPISGLSGAPVGVLADAVYEEERLPALAGDILLLTTDGVSEIFSTAGRGAGGQDLGGHDLGGLGSTWREGEEDGVRSLLAGGPHDVGEIVRGIAATVDGAASERDDVAVLGLQI